MAACVDDGGVDTFLHAGGEGGLDGIGFSGMSLRWRGLKGIMRKNGAIIPKHASYGRLTAMVVCAWVSSRCAERAPAAASCCDEADAGLWTSAWT